MVDTFKVNPFGGASEIPGLETFDPFGQTTAVTAAAFYGGGCEPPIEINGNCPCAE